MFFYSKIKSIGPGDKVLEVGPGGTPHPRADVFLELEMDSSKYAKAQRGNTAALITDKPVVYYDGKTFPFKNCEFDYVIATHVFEHVPDVEQFAAEIFRVGKGGYIEYPTIYYEYLYNFNVHLNILKYTDGTLHYIKKQSTHINDFKPVQDFFLKTLDAGHNKFINDLLPYMAEGFEWNKPFKIEPVKDVADLIWPNNTVVPPPPLLEGSRSFHRRALSKVLRNLGTKK